MPLIQVPIQASIATKLLQLVYDEERALVIEELKKVPFVTIVTDGWTNPNNEGIVNFIVTSPTTKPAFFKSICTSTSKHTADFMLQPVEVAIDEVEQVIGTGKVVAVLADNAQTILSMQRQLGEKRPIVGNGCAAHAMDLLVKDITSIPFLLAAIEGCVKLTKFIKKRSALALTFRQIQRSAHSERNKGLRLPVATRWYTSKSCVAGICQNEWTIQSLFTKSDLLERYGTNNDNSAKLAASVTIIRDKSFWERAQVTLDYVSPINEALAKFERDQCCLSLLYQVFKDLLKHDIYSQPPILIHNEAPTFPEPSTRSGPRPRKRTITSNRAKKGTTATTTSEESPPDLQLHELVRRMIEKRWAFLHTDAMGIAFLLDHTKSTLEFVGDDYHCAREEAVKLAKRLNIVDGDTETSFRRQLDSFENMKNYWSDAECDLHHKSSPFKWWYNEKMFGLLREIALRIFSICTSSAASERAWSAFKHLHSDLRNNLKTVTVDKLVFIYTSMDRNDKQSDDILYLTDPGFADGAPDDETAAPRTSTGSEDSAPSMFSPACTPRPSIFEHDDTQRRLSLDGADSQTSMIDLGYDHLSPNLEASMSA